MNLDAGSAKLPLPADEERPDAGAGVRLDRDNFPPLATIEFEWGEDGLDRNHLPPLDTLEWGEDEPRDSSRRIPHDDSRGSPVSQQSLSCELFSANERKLAKLRRWLSRIRRRVSDLPMIQQFQYIVYITWLASIIIVLAFGAWRLLSDAGQHMSDVGSLWEVTEVAWPPFFAPSAAVLETGAETGAGILWLASGWELSTLHLQSSKSAGKVAVSRAARLPLAATGLLLPPSSPLGLEAMLWVASEEALLLVQLPDATRTDATSDRQFVSSMQGAAHTQRVTLLGQPVKVPASEIGRPVAVAAARMALAGAAAQEHVVVMVSAAGDIYLSTATALDQMAETRNVTAPRDLQVAVQVPRRQARALAVHVCSKADASTSEGPNADASTVDGPNSPSSAVNESEDNISEAIGGTPVATEASIGSSCGANETTLWVADADGCLTATGLETGRVLTSRHWSAWHGASLGGSLAVALTGNATHLVLIAPQAPGGQQVLHVAPYARLLEQDAGDTLCAGAGG